MEFFRKTWEKTPLIGKGRRDTPYTTVGNGHDGEKEETSYQGGHVSIVDKEDSIINLDVGSSEAGAGAPTKNKLGTFMGVYVPAVVLFLFPLPLSSYPPSPHAP